MAGESGPGPGGGAQALRLLVIASDRFEPFRVDVRILFAKELVARGYRIDWILQSEAACGKSYRTAWGGGDAWVGSTDLGTSRLARLRKHVLALLNELRVFGLVRRGRYDCIVVKDEFVAPLLALAAGRWHGVPVAYWLSFPFPEESLLLARDGTARYPILYFIRGLAFRFLLYRVIMPLSRHVFVQSEQMKRDVAAAGIPPAKLTPVPMGVDLGMIPAPSAADSPAADVGRSPVMLYLGTLMKVRRLDFLVRVLARVRERVPGARLVLVGDGDDPSDRALIEAEAHRLGVEGQVEITGFLPMAEAWRRVAQADVCLSPFYPTPILNSTSPTKLIEYMALGRPVVANDHPEQRLVIGESQAGLCVRWDEGEFASAVVRILEDPQAAADMGRRGRRYVESFRAYGVIARMVDETFRQFIGRPAGPRP